MARHRFKPLRDLASSCMQTSKISREGINKATNLQPQPLRFLFRDAAWRLNVPDNHDVKCMLKETFLVVNGR